MVYLLGFIGTLNSLLPQVKASLVLVAPGDTKIQTNSWIV